MGDWRQYAFRLSAVGYKAGWRGVWEHFKDALRGRRPTFVEEQQVVVSFYAKFEGSAKLTHVQLEPIRPPK